MIFTLPQIQGNFHLMYLYVMFSLRSFYDFYSSSNTGKFPFNVLICNVLPDRLCGLWSEFLATDPEVQVRFSVPFKVQCH
jgi:hypothetical protein